MAEAHWRRQHHPKWRREVGARRGERRAADWSPPHLGRPCLCPWLERERGREVSERFGFLANC